MNIIEQLETDLKQSQIEQDKLKTETLRLLKNALKNYQIEIGHQLTANEMLEVLKKEAKKRRDSIDAYLKGDRKDLADAEEAELNIIDKYLPNQLSEEEVSKIVDQVIIDSGAKDSSSMGQVIGTAMKKAEGNADGAMVSRIVRQKLS